MLVRRSDRPANTYFAFVVVLRLLKTYHCPRPGLKQIINMELKKLVKNARLNSEETRAVMGNENLLMTGTEIVRVDYLKLKNLSNK